MKPRLYLLTHHEGRGQWCVLARNKAESVGIVAGYGDDVSDARTFTVTRVAPGEPVTQWQDEDGQDVVTLSAREWVERLIAARTDCVYCPRC